MKPNLLLLSTSSSRNAGGLYNSVRNLGQQLKHLDKVSPIAFAFHDEHSEIDTLAYNPLPLEEYNIIGPPGIGFSLDLRKKIENLSPNIVHVQGIWLYSSHVNKNYCVQKNVPYLISPRGMLDPWILTARSWKKKLGLLLYESAHLKHATCLHALCIPEYNALRKFGCKNPIAIIPNGVFLPSTASIDQEAPSWKRNDNRKVLLFLSRLHVKKGIENLMKAWVLIDPSLKKNWKVVIAGESKNSNYLDSLLELSNKLNLNNDFFFIGPQFHNDKDNCFRNADAFILPSYSEGMPMAVLEAWSYSLPVVITEDCNLPDGFENNAAIKIETNPETMSKTLNSFFLLSKNEFETIGKNGLTLVKEKYTWDSIAIEMTKVYSWCLDKNNPIPDCIKMN